MSGRENNEDDEAQKHVKIQQTATSLTTERHGAGPAEGLANAPGRGGVVDHVPYRRNRAVIFVSDRYHASEPFDFPDSAGTRRRGISRGVRLAVHVRPVHVLPRAKNPVDLGFPPLKI